MQHALTWIIVLACAAYASWALMPAAARRALLRRLGRPEPVATGCQACSGGCGTKQAPQGVTQTITLHRRAPDARAP